MPQSKKFKQATRWMKFLVAVALSSCGGARAASAASKSASFDVSLRIVANCSVAAEAIDLGQKQGVISSEISASGQVKVACTDTTPYAVGFDAGTGAGSAGSNRYLSSPSGDKIQFNLYGSSGSSLGSNPGVNTESGIGNGATQSIAIHAKVPAQTTPTPGIYRSTITATVYF